MKDTTLKTLRVFLNKNQREMAVLVNRTRHLIESIEQRRAKLSAKLALEISRATGIDFYWLVDDDLSVPMVNRVGAPYTKKDFDFAQDKELEPLQFYQVTPEMEVINASSILLRALAAARKKNAVAQFIHQLKGLVRGVIHRDRELKDEIYGALRTGPFAKQDFLFPRTSEPLKHVKRRAVEAIAEFEARSKAIKK
jgi:transcriptional regulator with XRE-family HTH domain